MQVRVDGLQHLIIIIINNNNKKIKNDNNHYNNNNNNFNNNNNNIKFEIINFLLIQAFQFSCGFCLEYLFISIT